MECKCLIVDFSLPSSREPSWHIGSRSASRCVPIGQCFCFRCFKFCKVWDELADLKNNLFAQIAGCVEHQTPFHSISCRGSRNGADPRWQGNLRQHQLSAEIRHPEGGKHHIRSFCIPSVPKKCTGNLWFFLFGMRWDPHSPIESRIWKWGESYQSFRSCVHQIVVCFPKSSHVSLANCSRFGNFRVPTFQTARNTASQQIVTVTFL